MKASELITALNQMITERGDLPVDFMNSEDEYREGCLEEVSIVGPEVDSDGYARIVLQSV